MNRAGRPIFGRVRTHRWASAFLAALALSAAAATSATAARRSDSSLATRLQRALRVPRVSTSRSAAIAVDLLTGERVFALNDGLPLAPASNEKLAVTYAALELLGPDFKLKTSVVTTGTRHGSTLHGTLYLVGGGDPTLTHGGLAALARAVRAAGIRRVTGAVVGDESLFDGERTAPGWKPSFYVEESPPLSALVVDHGRYRKHFSRIPALAATLVFRDALRAVGVSVLGSVSVGRAPATATDVAVRASPRLATIVCTMDQQSDNFIAETLLKVLSLEDVRRGSTAAGAKVVTRTLREAGIPMQGVRIVDGSGLSRLDRLTVDALVAILQALHDDSALRPVLAHALPVAGETGTLSDRMREPQLRGKVIAKTGTTDQASALAGFVKGRYAFAIVQNGHPISYFWARVAQDRFARVLASR